MADTKEKTRPQKPQKFFFDQNCFDDDFEEEVIEEEPPPPVFNEEELAAAKDESYKRGRAEALAEAEASREKHIATLLGTIEKHFQTLFNAEQLRASQYENEAVLVTRTIFEKLFPALNEKEGLNEIESVIISVLEKQREQHDIVIEVHPDYTDSIDARLEKIKPTLSPHSKITVAPAESLGPGDCQMRWNDGGAHRDITSLTEEIHRQLEHMLADKPTLQDNKEEIAVEDEADNQNDDVPPVTDTEDNTTNGDDP